MSRKTIAMTVISNPEAYKICEGCTGIVTKRVARCPACASYRFNDNPTEVARQAKELGSRPSKTRLE